MKGGKIQSTPAIPRANRGLFDINQALWSGFVITGYIKNKLQNIWFAGDTGFSSVLEKKVAKRLPRVDLAIIPIGAFLPRNLMKPFTLHLRKD